MEFLFLGILIGIVIDKYIFGIFDVLFELFTYIISEYCTESKIRSESIAKEFDLKYGDVPELTPAIGFHHEPAQEIIQEEEIEDKNKMGFIK